MTQDPHRSSWDPPGGEQPVEPSAGSTQPEVSDRPTVHDQDTVISPPDRSRGSGTGGTGGWAQPSGSAPAPQPAPPAHDGSPHQHGQGYGQGYGQQPAYGQQPHYAPQGHSHQHGQGVQHGYAGVPASQAPRSAVPTPAIVLLVISGLLSLVLSWTVVGLAYLAPTVLGVVAVARGGGDPAGSRRLTRTGWVVFGIVTVVIGLLVVVGAVLLFSLRGGSGGGGVPGGVSV